MPTWSTALATGHATIDAQHQEIFDRSDALLAASRGGTTRQEIGPLLDFLRDYCMNHLSLEAGLMREVRYPKAKAHLAQHDHFIEQFIHIQQEYQANGPSTLIAVDLRRLVCEWFVHHVRSADAELGLFVAAGGQVAASPRS